MGALKSYAERLLLGDYRIEKVGDIESRDKLPRFLRRSIPHSTVSMREVGFRPKAAARMGKPGVLCIYRRQPIA